MTDAAELRAIVREELAGLVGKPRKSHDNRPIVGCRVQPADLPAIDAAAEQRGMTRSAFLRFAIETVSGSVLSPVRPIPPELARSNRRKGAHYSDPANPRERAQLAATARDGIIAVRMMRAQERASDAMLAEAPAASPVPKTAGKLSD